ncbi:hypothetical protein [Spirillospora sp. NPDC048824]|uniref:hypothetical protein n=1 Tax=Spirillospora sp. NPDC048824 TaxID=3364526 RepID=UPI0037242CBC
MQRSSAYTAQRAMEAGLLDEVRVHLVPVLFGRSPAVVRRLAADHETPNGSNGRLRTTWFTPANSQGGPP